jgi:hypothetical protein
MVAPSPVAADGCNCLFNARDQPAAIPGWLPPHIRLPSGNVVHHKLLMATQRNVNVGRTCVAPYTSIGFKRFTNDAMAFSLNN